jgi:hypothetical protein
VVKCIRDHIRHLDDLPNGTALAQEIVAGSVLPITEILIIEHHKLNSTFLHVAFGSQSLLKPTSDQTGSDTNWRTGEGNQRRGEWEPIKILKQELAYVQSLNPKSKTLQESDEHTNQQQRNDPLKVMNAAEKEWD